jgi:outer membrane biogenesis lipoprotein LolB
MKIAISFLAILLLVSSLVLSACSSVTPYRANSVGQDEATSRRHDFEMRFEHDYGG